MNDQAHNVSESPQGISQDPSAAVFKETNKRVFLVGFVFGFVVCYFYF